MVFSWTYVSHKGGAKWQAYPPLVALGSQRCHCALCHKNMPLQGKSLLCLDAIREWQCHSSDIMYVSSDTRLCLVRSILICQTPAKLGYVP